MYQEKRWFLPGILSLVTVLMLFGWVGHTQSQEKYPTRAIDLIIPYGPGGAIVNIHQIFKTCSKDIIGEGFG